MSGKLHHLRKKCATGLWVSEEPIVRKSFFQINSITCTYNSAYKNSSTFLKLLVDVILKRTGGAKLPPSYQARLKLGFLGKKFNDLHKYQFYEEEVMQSSGF